MAVQSPKVEGIDITTDIICGASVVCEVNTRNADCDGWKTGDSCVTPIWIQMERSQAKIIPSIPH